MPQLFISYSRKDGPFAHKLADALTQVGVGVWIDTQDIQPGMKWSQVIQQGLDSCEVMLVIVSPDSMASSNVEDEWQYYLDHGKKVIPLLWQLAKLHFQLNRLQHINFNKVDFDTALGQLLLTLGIQTSGDVVAAKRAYDILRREYEDWAAFGKNSGQLLKANLIKRIFEHVNPLSITTDLMEYLLTSTASVPRSEIDEQTAQGLSEWLINTVDQTEVSGIIGSILQTDDLTIRIGLLNLVSRLELALAGDAIAEHITTEEDTQTLQTALNTLSHLDYELPVKQAQLLFNRVEDWLVRTFTLKSCKQGKAALLISDGTQFAQQLGYLAKTSGYTLVTLTPEFPIDVYWRLYEMSDDLLNVYDLVVLVRGEHADGLGSQQLYQLLRQLVQSGGALLATAWVGWETKHDPFADILPFQYREFTEDITLECRRTNSELSEELFEGNISYLTSYEISQVREGSHVLLETIAGVPVFGYRLVGDGACYYLNSCQHSCRKRLDSPFELSPALRDSMQRAINWIYATQRVE